MFFKKISVLCILVFFVINAGAVIAGEEDVENLEVEFGVIVEISKEKESGERLIKLADGRKLILAIDLEVLSATGKRIVLKRIVTPYDARLVLKDTPKGKMVVRISPHME